MNDQAAAFSCDTRHKHRQRGRLCLHTDSALFQSRNTTVARAESLLTLRPAVSAPVSTVTRPSTLLCVCGGADCFRFVSFCAQNCCNGPDKLCGQQHSVRPICIQYTAGGASDPQARLHAGGGCAGCLRCLEYSSTTTQFCVLNSVCRRVSLCALRCCVVTMHAYMFDAPACLQAFCACHFDQLPFVSPLPLTPAPHVMHLTRYWTPCTALVSPVLLQGVGMCMHEEGLSCRPPPSCTVVALYYDCGHYDCGRTVLWERWLILLDAVTCVHVCICRWLFLFQCLVL